MTDATQRLTQMAIDVGDEQVVLERIRTTEKLGRAFTIEADVISPLELDLQPHLGKPAMLAVTEDGELQRRFHGLVTEGAYLKETQAGHHYRLTIRPWTYYLDQNSQMAIFQDKTAVEIIKGVIEGAGIQDVDYTGLSKPRVTRGYCVQYRESDFTFVTRLLEEEGIYYFWQHDADRHVMVLCEAPANHQPGKPATLAFNANSVSVFTTDSKQRFGKPRDYLQSWVERVTSSGQARVTTRDFDFESPDQPLAAESVGAGAHPRDDREIFIYPGRYTREKTGRGDQEQVGRDRGQVLLDAQRAGRRTFTGQSQAAGITTGYRVDVTEHPADRMNASYLVTAAHHSIASESYRSGEQDEEDPFNVRFEAIPADTPFQTPPQTPKPRSQGLETAIVTGPAGETIYTDEYGRVKVRFHWDRAGTPPEQSTCWVRVSQTGGLGNNILPRVGHEVLVDFLDGDPDRPIVMGRVFNRTNMPVYDLPANKTKALWASLNYGAPGDYPEAEPLDRGTNNLGNRIEMEDAGGRQEMYIHAERDMNSRVRADETRRIGRHQTRRVGKDRGTEIGRDDTKLIRGKRKTHVMGKDTLDVDGALHIESKTNIRIKVGASVIDIAPDRVTIQSPQIEVQASAKVAVNAGVETAIRGGGELRLTGGRTDINGAAGPSAFGHPRDFSTRVGGND